MYLFKNENEVEFRIANANMIPPEPVQAIATSRLTAVHSGIVVILASTPD